MASLSTEQMIEGYFLATTKAVGTLFREELYAHTLIIIYSTIDTCGLLDAPPSQTTASGASFKAWVKKYLLDRPGIEFTDVDLWAARCAVLHTFTSESDMSKAGQARQLQYYTGDKATDHVQNFVSFTRSHDGGKHLPVHYGDLCEGFFQAIKTFVPDLFTNCTSSSDYDNRLRKILQMVPYGPAL
jgi:hypothetical protein